MLTFDRLEAGQLLGEVILPVEAECLRAWAALFPGSLEAAGEHLPCGLVVALMMRGYIKILAERPSGNVHVEQGFFWGARVLKGTHLVVRLSCLRKELKGERRWVWFANQLDSTEGVFHARSTMKFLWAA
jgi:hypothetical protein